MKVILLGLSVFLLSIVSVTGQNLAEKAEVNPLDLAYYLIDSHKSPEDYTDELWSISLDYFRTGRESDALNVLEKMNNVDRKTDAFLILTSWTKREGRLKKAEYYLSKASETNLKNVYAINIENSQEIASKWVELNRENLALRELSFYKNEVKKASILNSISNTYIKNGNSVKALQYLSLAEKFLENTELKEFDTLTKAQIARSFSQIKNKDKAQKMIASVEEIYPKIEYSSNYPKDREIKKIIIETYINLANYEKTVNLIGNETDLQSPEGLIKLTETNLKLGEIEKAKNFLQKVSAFEDDNYEKLQAVNFYLQINEDVFALELAASLTTDFRKFEALQAVVEKLIARGQVSEALAIIKNILDMPFINNNENPFFDESLSDKEEQLAFVFDKYNELKRPDLALQIMNAANGLDIKASMLTSFVRLYKNKLPKQAKIAYIDQAKEILSKSKRSITGKILFDAWLDVAVEFAEIEEKEKSIEMFAQILEYLYSLEYISESEQIDFLSKISLNFAETNLSANERMKIALKKLKIKWLEQNN